MKKQLYRAAAATVLGLSLMTATAAAQTPYQHYNSKHHDSSHQVPTDNQLSLSSVTNHNSVNAVNNTNQVTQSGDANVVHNHTGGSAKTGDVTASNNAVFTISVND